MKNISLIIASSIAVSASHVHANYQADDIILEDFIEARLQEINKKDSSALKGYNRLFVKQSNSEILADRLFEIALRQGDVKTALIAINKLDSDTDLPVQAHILRYSNALKKQEWKKARQALIKVKSDPVFGFMAPIMGSWVDVANGNDGTILLDRDKNSGLTNFYARDQIVYQYLVLRKYDKVEKSIVSVRPFNEAFARNLILKSAPILAQNDKENFASALLRAQGSGAATAFLSRISDGKKLPSHSDKISADIGVARLFGRVSNTLIDQKLFDMAQFFARTAQWLAPNDPVVMLHLADALGANDQIDSANKILSNWHSNDPYYSLFASQNIRMLLEKDRGIEAVQIAERARKERPQSQTLMLLLAQTYDSVEQYDKAASTYDILIDTVGKDQKLRESYLRLYQARSLTNGKQWKKAKKTLEKGLALKAKNPFLLNYLGYSLLERGEDIERGFDLVKKAHKLEPNSPDITDSLGWGYYLKGDLQKALPLLEKAARTSEDDSEIKEHLGDAYWSVGRRIDARYTWRIAALSAAGNDKKRLDHKAKFGLDVPYS